jgi:hypothetical protein
MISRQNNGHLRRNSFLTSEAAPASNKVKRSSIKTTMLQSTCERQRFAPTFMSYIDGHIDHHKEGPRQKRSKTSPTGKRMTKQPIRNHFKTPKQGKGNISNLISLNTKC